MCQTENEYLQKQKKVNQMEKILEISKPITDFDGLYEISLDGVVKSLERKVQHLQREITIKPKILKTRINNCGYVSVRLSKKGKTYTKFIHVILADAFIPNPDNKLYVNHLDGNKLNNAISNLAWCTHSENIKHAYDNGLIRPIVKPVIDICTGDTYDSVRTAASVYQINYSTLKGYLNKSRENFTCLNYAYGITA